jgi:uncharacterized protein YbjT (DUF2867 family)
MNVILFGATGMVGQSVLRECLLDHDIHRVLVIGRSPTGRSHPKLTEVVHADMFEPESEASHLQGFDACFFCLGGSSAGMSEADYTRLTFDLTMVWARVLARVNPSMTFQYVSGVGTGGRSMWARVKGRTENALLALFPRARMIRLGALIPVNGEVSKTRWARLAYAVLRPFVPFLRAVAPNLFITS